MVPDSKGQRHAIPTSLAICIVQCNRSALACVQVWLRKEFGPTANNRASNSPLHAGAKSKPPETSMNDCHDEELEPSVIVLMMILGCLIIFALCSVIAMLY
jgi:hypothetical protein